MHKHAMIMASGNQKILKRDTNMKTNSICAKNYTFLVKKCNSLQNFDVKLKKTCALDKMTEIWLHKNDHNFRIKYIDIQ